MIVPKSHESNGRHNRHQSSVSAQGDVEVPDEPLVEPPMPHPPKALKTVIVAHASAQIVHNLYPAHRCPCSRHSPYYQKFEPYEHQVKKSENLCLHEALFRSERDHRAVMLVNLETGKQEETPEDLRPLCGWDVPERNEIFVGDGRSSEKGRCKKDVIHITFKGIVLSKVIISALQTRTSFCAFFTPLLMLLQLSLLPSPVFVYSERKQLEKSHIKHLSTTNLP